MVKTKTKEERMSFDDPNVRLAMDTGYRNRWEMYDNEEEEEEEDEE